MKVEFVSTIAMITSEPQQSRQLYVNTLGLPLTGGTSDGYLRSEQVPGTKHFGVWPLSQAAEACFGDERRPADLAIPRVSTEFDVADVDSVEAAADELAAAGHELLHPVRQEP
jgi:catechol 2,3-dioxygenase-like lactoylglutathione lyase family enzyme